MKNKLLGIAGFLLYLPRLGWRWASALSKNAVWRLPGVSVDAARGLVIPDLGCSIPEPNEIGMAALRAIRLATDLHQRGGAKWSFESNAALLEFEGISVRAYNTADIYMLHEIFVERLYAFQLPGKFLVLDIGANTGASMLFFAKNYAAEVRGFELVPSTAALASQNLALNPSLTALTKLHPFGLGESDKQLDLSCDPAFRPSNSMLVPAAGKSSKIESVTVKDVAPVVTQALADLGERKLVVKLDAEGAEYAILRRLADRDLVRKIDLLFIEWHEIEGEDPVTIRTLLTGSGFTWFEREHASATVGFITAFRR